MCGSLSILNTVKPRSNGGGAGQECCQITCLPLQPDDQEVEIDEKTVFELRPESEEPLIIYSSTWYPDFELCSRNSSAGVFRDMISAMLFELL